MSAFPFGKEIVHVRQSDQKGLSTETAITGTIGFIANIVWLCTFGIVLFIAYIAAGILACITIIGIPFGLMYFKIAAISVWPVGRRVVSNEVAKILRREDAEKMIAAYRKN